MKKNKGIWEQMQEGNKVFFPQDFTIEKMREVIRGRWSDRKYVPTPNLTIHVGGDTYELINAENSFKEFPDMTTLLRLQAINDKIDKGVKERRRSDSSQFIEKYGLPIFQFVRNLSHGRIRFGTYIDYLSWEVKCSDCPEEDSLSVKFDKGIFNLVVDYLGGYAGSKVIEENLPKERVLELLKKR